MAGRGIDRVLIELSPKTIALPWSSREALLAELRPIEAMREVVLAFEAVGTSRPVELTPEQKDDLQAVLTGWAQETDGDLPDGVPELSNALQDDLRETRRRNQSEPAIGSKLNETSGGLRRGE